MERYFSVSIGDAFQTQAEDIFGREKRDFDIPYWRTLKADGYLNDKFPGGAESHKELLENERFKVIRKGKKYYVENYQNYLIKDY